MLERLFRRLRSRPVYRVVRDHWSGYAFERRLWRFLWWRAPHINTWRSADEAEAAAILHAVGLRCRQCPPDLRPKAVKYIITND